jgi:hypothetical protein
MVGYTSVYLNHKFSRVSQLNCQQMPSIQRVIFAMEITQVKSVRLGTHSLKQSMLILCQTTADRTTPTVQHIIPIGEIILISRGTIKLS